MANELQKVTYTAKLCGIDAVHEYRNTVTKVSVRIHHVRQHFTDPTGKISLVKLTIDC